MNNDILSRLNAVQDCDRLTDRQKYGQHLNGIIAPCSSIT